MQSLNETQVAAAIAPLISSVGSKYMLDPETMEHGVKAGYPIGFAYYVAGRGGVLGDVESDVVYSAFMFFDRSLIDKLWKTGIAIEGARQAGKRYMQSCDEWGRKHLSSIENLDQFIAPAEKLISQVDASGLSLFAGLRAEQLPADSPARAYRLMALIRELRGCMHIAACIVHGLSGLEATLLSSGEGSAKLHGFQPPYVDCSHLSSVRDEVEKATSATMARLIGLHLSEQEMNQLADSTARIAAAVA